VNTVQDGATPLLVAARKGHKEVASLLLAAGADYRVTDNFARTALIYAIIQNHFKIVDVLLSEPGMHINAKNYWSETEISFAARLGCLDIFRKIAAVPDVDLHGKDSFGRTSLWWAEKQGHISITRDIIEHYPSINEEPTKS
jgi:ankyrin repeat protein